MATGVLRAAISSVLDSTPALSDRSSRLQRLGKEILERSTLGEAEQMAFDGFSEQLVSYIRGRIKTAAEGTAMNCSKRFKIWSDFHKVRLDTSGPMHSGWVELLRSLRMITSAEYDPLLEQSLYSELYGVLVAEYFRSPSMSSQSAHPSVQTATAPTQFTTDELNAMRYACGYVPYKLLKKYDNKTGEMYSQYVQCLGDMAVEGEEDFLGYTRKWLDQVNRGGLFPLNEKAFALFIEIEKCVRLLLPQHIIRGDSDKATFKRCVLEKIVKNEDVQFNWLLLSQDIDDVAHAEHLLTEIVNLWVTIRGYSIAASWMAEYKKNARKTTQKSTGLRKSISGMS